MIDESLYTLLKANTGVHAIVADRIYALEAPQEADLPCLVYEKVSATGRELYHNGVTNHCDVRFQITCIGDTPLKAKTAAAAVVKATHGYRGSIGGHVINFCRVENEVDLIDEATQNYVVAVDVMISHKEN
jgi:hypothetical protein